MTISKHITIATILASFVNIPIIGFVIGFISHAVLDSLPQQQYQFNLFKPDKFIVAIESLIIVIMIYVIKGNTVLIMSFTGAVIPDIIDGLLSIINKNRYKTGNHLFFFHKLKGQTSRSRKQTIILSLVFFLIAVII